VDGTILKVIRDDGGVLEAIVLAYYAALDSGPPATWPVAITFADLYSYTIRDPTTEEASHANAVLTILTTNTDKVGIAKTTGAPISLE
jgi:exosome complex RNA-binding protein Rrp42 (RNase PH superfamily)